MKKKEKKQTRRSRIFFFFFKRAKKYHGDVSRLWTSRRSVMRRYSPGAVAADGSVAPLSNSWLLGDTPTSAGAHRLLSRAIGRDPPASSPPTQPSSRSKQG